MTSLHVSLILLYQAHFDLQILDEHVHGVVILMAERYDQISMLHCRLDKVIVCRFDKAIILSKHVDYSTTALCDVSLNLEKEISMSTKVNHWHTYFYELIGCHLESERRV